MQTFRQARNLSVVQAEMMGEDPGDVRAAWRGWQIAQREPSVWENAVYFEDQWDLTAAEFHVYATTGVPPTSARDPGAAGARHLDESRERVLTVAQYALQRGMRNAWGQRYP